MKRTFLARSVVPFILLITSWLAPFEDASAQMFNDDFDDGNITGWSTYNPLGVFSNSFPQPGKVQLQSTISPNLSFGPGRGALYRNDLPQTGDHAVAAEFSSYEINNQFFGVISRMRQIGPGTLDAYVLSYSPQWFSNFPRARFAIDRLDNEARTTLAEFRMDELAYDGNYRLSLTLEGNQLTGVLTDLLNTLTPLSTLTATDNTYTQGLSGLFVAGSLVNNTTTLVNFDNFSIQAIPEPGLCGLIFVIGIAVALKCSGLLGIASDQHGSSK
jgi:hypothetical protein